MAQKLIQKKKMQTEKLKTLVIEDELSVRLGIACTLEGSGYKVATAENGADGIELFKKESFDIVVTDLRLPGADGLEVLRAVKGISPETGVIVITAFADVKTAVEAMKIGAYDYLSKPFDSAELLIVIERFLNHRALEIENIRLRAEVRDKKQFHRIIGASPAMQAIFETIEAAAKSDSSIIIYGESGTGKELVANAIHDLSMRKDKPFIKINCAAIPETLLESELFGHEKGAFTGAVQRRKGKFEIADGGSIFLDEIGDMPVSIQAKLLRVLESHTFERLGGNEPITVDVRTIYATKKNLKDEIKSGRFREDLFFRINVLPVRLPPLRERKEDIAMLVDHFLKTFGSKSGKGDISLTSQALEKLSVYDYPGNVRELEHAIETAVVLCKGSRIDICCLPAEIRGTEMKQEAEPCKGLPLTERVRTFERDVIAHALEEAGGKKKEAAKRLGVSRGTLWRKLKEYGFPVSDSEFED
jgi:DNA-binding NtrC family response regulator